MTKRGKTTAALQLTKLAAAQRQLDAAIRLTLQGEDEVAIHTIAAAAYRILRDIKQKRKGRGEFSDMITRGLFFVAQDLASGKISKPPGWLTGALAQAVNTLSDLIKTGKLQSEDQFSFSTTHDEEKRHLQAINAASNFLKHADRDSEDALNLSEINNDIILASACDAYLHLMGASTPEIDAYTIYRFGDDPVFSTPSLYSSPAAVHFRELSPKSRRRFCLQLIREWKRAK